MDTTGVGVPFPCVATALFGAIGIGGAIDLVMDNPQTLWSVHVLFDVAMLVLSLGGVAYSWLGCRDTRHSLQLSAFFREDLLLPNDVAQVIAIPTQDADAREALRV